MAEAQTGVHLTTTIMAVATTIMEEAEATITIAILVVTTLTITSTAIITRCKVVSPEISGMDLPDSVAALPSK